LQATQREGLQEDCRLTVRTRVTFKGSGPLVSYPINGMVYTVEGSIQFRIDHSEALIYLP
jgi:hypothetical protein